ncbi:MAG: carbon starvation protein A [Candidatus Omnitrophica bacterium]|nr:carbon starvation protein A [Candidatus Omnitrophota bacterium]
MNLLLLIGITLVLFFLGYRFYSRVVERQFGVEPDRQTPAHTKYDGVDYVPAKHWTMLFGHHFASIAGAAPIIGPVLAVSIWGWAPTILWIVIGSVLMGGVHDFCSLLISVKHEGSSIAEVTKKCISKRAKTVFLIFVWLTLILIIAVFVTLSAKTLVVKPEIVLPSLGLIPLAIIVGFLLYNLKLNQPLVTFFGLGTLALLMILGRHFPINLGGNPVMIWGIILLVYSFVASVTPVQILLQPRDYLSSFPLLLGLLIGFAGLVLFGHGIKLPAFVSPDAVPGTMPLWPLLFVTVACGAISGFHSIIASGTTSKQIASERHARHIGYGGMIAEGLLAAMTVFVLIVVFKDQGEIQKAVAGGAGPINAFGIAYGEVTKKIMGGYGYLFAITILNAFILTTLDSAARIGRYITQELFGISNRFLATFIVVILSGWLALSGKWTQIWPLFGSANQLIAALTLIVVTSWLLSRRKKVLYTLVPTIFMLVTTMGALVIKIVEYFAKRESALLLVSAVLLGLAIFIFAEAVKETGKVFRRRIA